MVVIGAELEQSERGGGQRRLVDEGVLDGFETGAGEFGGLRTRHDDADHAPAAERHQHALTDQHAAVGVAIIEQRGQGNVESDAEDCHRNLMGARYCNAGNPRNR
ncbi:hypothetical protein GALL_374890 [mine drainage metagenome]|uniref:Uncharacterized protein n=1 Tax=mine drainage metagenome TaxID=410659 RepID=A0A1J5QXY9_9ZZZZ